MLECDLTPSRISASKQARDFRLRLARKAVIDRPINLKRPKAFQILIKDETAALLLRIAELEDDLAKTRRKLKTARNKKSYPQIINPVIHRIIDVLIAGENVTKSALTSRRRSRNIIVAKHIGFYLARKKTDLSLAVIGRQFGGRHHTTLMAAIDKIELQRIADPVFDEKIRWYEGRL